MLPTSNEDRLFVENLNKGSESAYQYLIDQYYKSLFAYALSLTRDREAAKDIVQNVFLNTWIRRESLGRVVAVKSFLYQSTYNEFVTQYRKTQSATSLHQAYLEALSEASGEEATALERKVKLLSQGIEQLPLKCREILILSKKEGLTNLEISEYLNLSTKTVEGQLTKAYKLLRKLVSDNATKGDYWSDTHHLQTIALVLFCLNTTRFPNLLKAQTNEVYALLDRPLEENFGHKKTLAKIHEGSMNSD